MDTISRKVFYMMRHGETTDNEAGVISGGDRDVELTQTGRDQAAEARKVYLLMQQELERHIPERTIATRLKRTHQTAEIVIGHSHFEKESGLDERRMGELNGQPAGADRGRNGTLPGEESVEQHQERAVKALNRRLNESDATTLFVTHGGTIRRIMDAAGMKDRIGVSNAAIYQFVPVKDKWMIFELTAAHGKLHKINITPGPTFSMTVGAGPN